jgi:peptidoglycan-associated lipoprotein
LQIKIELKIEGGVMYKMKYLVLVSMMAALVIAGCKKQTKLPPVAEQPPVEEAEEIEQPTPESPQVPEEQEVVKKEIEFEMVHFDFDKYNLRPDAIAALNQNAKVLMENPRMRIRIEGHCDERGTVEYNLALGEKRAMAAKEYLVKLGISPSRIEIISYGKERPLDTRSNEQAWAKNRRDEFKTVSS